MNKIILSAAALLLLIFDIRAQNYTVDWYKVSGGGGTSSGAQYTVTGTIGQHDAGGRLFCCGYLISEHRTTLLTGIKSLAAAARAVFLNPPPPAPSASTTPAGR